MTGSAPSLPRLDPANDCVWWGTRRVDLPANAFRVLAYLADRPNRIVTKDELLDAVWPGTHVIDAVLSVAVSQVRQALDDDPKAPRFVETVHRRGYRFIGSFAAGSPATAGDPPETPAVFGRDEALAELDLAVARAAQGKRQFVFVTGEPGIGKTTLVDAFLARLAAAAAGGAILVARGQCVDTFGAGEPCMPLLEALDEMCRSSRNRVEVLRVFAPTWLLQLPGVLEAGEADELRRNLATSTGERMMRELQRALENLAAEATIVLVLEDLHWSDATTISMLAALASRRETARLLVVGTWRPADAIASQHPVARLRHDLAAKRLSTEIALDGLGAPSIAAWLTRRFEHNRFETALAERLHAQTDGNPLFLVNAIEHLQQQGWLHESDGAWECSVDLTSTGDAVPDSTREMIEARLARRTDEEQRILESASVIGGSFAAQALAAACAVDLVELEASCTKLAREGQFLAALPAAEWPDGSASAQYAFRHALYQQVLFDRVTPARRRSIDLAVARRLEAGYGTRAGEISVPLATYYERGGDADRAATWRRAAAETALRRYAYGPAADHMRHALSLLASLPESEARSTRELEIRTDLITAILWTEGGHAAELEFTVARVIELSESSAMSMLLVRAFNVVVTFLVDVGRIAEARRWSERFVERLRSEVGDGPVAVIAAAAIGVCQLLSGELADAEVHLAPPLELPDLGDITAVEPTITTGTVLGLVRCVRGNPRGGLALARNLFRRAVSTCNWPTTVYAGANSNMMAMLLGDHDFVEEVTERLSRIVDSLVASRWSGWAEMGKAWLRANRGDAAAIEEYDRARRSQQGYFVSHQAMHAVAQAELLVRFARYDEAQSILAEANDRMKETGEKWCEPEALRLRAMAVYGAARGSDGAASRQAAETAASLLSRATELAASQGARLWELRVAVSMVRLRRGADPAGELREIAVPAYRWFDDDLAAADVRAARALVG